MTTRPRYRQRLGDSVPNKKTFLEKCLQQTVVCAVITLALWGVSSIPAEPVKDAMQNLKNGLYYTVDYQATIQSMWNAAANFPQKWNANENSNEKERESDETNTNMESESESQATEQSTDVVEPAAQAE